jgi:hypothetical protein
MENMVTVTFRIDADRRERLCQMALVESVHARRRVTLSDLIRAAVEEAYPSESAPWKTASRKEGTPGKPSV